MGFGKSTLGDSQNRFVQSTGRRGGDDGRPGVPSRVVRGGHGVLVQNSERGGDENGSTAGSGRVRILHRSTRMLGLARKWKPIGRYRKTRGAHPPKCLYSKVSHIVLME